MFAMIVSLPLVAASATQIGMQVNLCTTTAPLVRAFFAQGAYIAPPEVAKLMFNVSNGRSDQVNRDVLLIKRTYKAPAVKHWLDLALYTAITDGRSDITEQLIQLGADVNARPEYPPFTSTGVAMVNLGQQMELHKLHINGKVSETFAKRLEPFPPTLPMLEQAAECSRIATLKILLTHKANMYPTFEANQAGFKYGILSGSINNHNEDSIEVLLDHGYDLCRDFQSGSNPKHLTDITLAKRVGLSAKLMQRLAGLYARCPAAAIPIPAH